MAILIDTLNHNDIVVLVNPGETIIGRYVGDGKTAETVTLYKPHVLMLRPTPQGGMSAGFMPYGDHAFMHKRDMRSFSIHNFITIDKTDKEMTEHFNTMLSGIKPVAKNKLIGLG